jgi:hypothetical protein
VPPWPTEGAYLVRLADRLGRRDTKGGEMASEDAKNTVKEKVEDVTGHEDGD